MDIEPAPAEEHHAMRRRNRLNMMSSRFYEPSAFTNGAKDMYQKRGFMR
jgi:hypothetical protein